jgi:hypothetical protein
MRVTKEVPGQGNIAGPMSTLWEGTTQVQGLRNKAPERGEGEMRQGQALTRQKKVYYCAPACIASVWRDQQVQRAMTCGAVRVPLRRMCRVFPVLARCAGA